MTSNALFKVIYYELWKKKNLEISTDKNTDAQLIIGDKALLFNEPHMKIADLGKIWKDETSLPFIYAHWVATKDAATKALPLLKKAAEDGLRNREKILSLIDLPLPKERIRHYMTSVLQYELHPRGTEALALFKEYCIKLRLLDEKKVLRRK